MSHGHERKDKDCLNCGTIVQGKYCHVCGQENVEPKETFWGMVVHFFNDITHFDGKFFVSMKWLFLKPGFLSAEYMKGRRASYLHPIRMYVFTSALFFIIFFSLFSVKDLDIVKENAADRLENAIAVLPAEAYKNAQTREDSIAIDRALGLVNLQGQNVKEDTARNKKEGGFRFGNADGKYKTIAAYDSAQHLLPATERDNWLMKQINRKGISLRQKYGDNNKELLTHILDKFIHSFPSLLFVSLPLYALFLKILYFRRKKFFYADHGVFLIHLYVFTFLLLLIFFFLDKLGDMTQLGVWSFFKFILILFGVVYAYLAMKRFYGQGGAKTLLKFILFNSICAVAVLFLFTFFFLFSVYRA